MFYIVLLTVSEQENLSFVKLRNQRKNFQIEHFLLAAKEILFARKSLPARGASSRRAAGLQPFLKNVRQKIPPNSQTRLKFRFSYENFTI